MSTKLPVAPKSRSVRTVQGVVGTYLPDASGRVSAAHTAPRLMIGKIQAGLPFRELETLSASLDVPRQTLAAKLGISKATLQRRKIRGRFDPAESDRLLRLARLLGKAAQVMESLEDGRRWLSIPQRGLAGAVPLAYAETEIGAREVEDLLGRIEYGVYS